jgi:TetR/AcrR family transcriptional repressor of mexJK operon
LGPVKKKLNRSVQSEVDATRPWDHVPAMAETVTTAPAEAAEPSRKQRQILDAAAALFMAHGYGPVSMDAIARAAGVSKATLYAHFASKDRLFATIVGDACGRNMVDESYIPPAGAPISEALRLIGGRLLRFMTLESTLAIFRTVVAESARFPELGEAFVANGPHAFLDWLTDWLASQCAQGRLRQADPAVMAVQFKALMHTDLLMRAFIGVGPRPTDAEIDAEVNAAVEMFLRAYGPSSHA